VIDLEAARAFLAKSRSGLLREAVRWLYERDDPVDLLFILSRDTADAMGPWDTFRYAALLGLTTAGPVRELGLDVLAEPLDEGDRLPPLHHALALAWAKRRFPDAAAPHAAAVLAALRDRPASSAPPALLLAAELALLPLVHEPTAETSARLLGLVAADDGPGVATTALEALVLAGAGEEARAKASQRMADGQQDDGGLAAPVQNVIVRGLTTLRALCLLSPPS
jgi:hypothetical protein